MKREFRVGQVPGLPPLVRNEGGAALVLALMTVTVLAVLSMITIMAVTQGMAFGSGYKTYQSAVYLADGGADAATGVIKRAIGNGMSVSSIDTGNTAMTFTSVSNLNTKLSGAGAIATPNSPSIASTAPDATVTVAGTTVSLEMEYLKSAPMPGSSAESAARYEGIGAGSAGGVAIYYQIDAYNGQPGGKSSTVRTVFKCVEGGGRCL